MERTTCNESTGDIKMYLTVTGLDGVAWIHMGKSCGSCGYGNKTLSQTNVGISLLGEKLYWLSNNNSAPHSYIPAWYILLNLWCCPKWFCYNFMLRQTIQTFANAHSSLPINKLQISLLTMLYFFKNNLFLPYTSSSS